MAEPRKCHVNVLSSIGSTGQQAQIEREGKDVTSWHNLPSLSTVVPRSRRMLKTIGDA
jgi:hypothetical protein